jgi:heme exporter protein D
MKKSISIEFLSEFLYFSGPPVSRRRRRLRAVAEERCRQQQQRQRPVGNGHTSEQRLLPKV